MRSEIILLRVCRILMSHNLELVRPIPPTMERYTSTQTSIEPSMSSHASSDSESCPAGKHLRDLDGIRGLSILFVLALHASYGNLGGGFLGVDIFFVLSGFLITALLLAEHQNTGRISLGSFYLRRAFRILPPIACCLVMTFFLWDIIAPPTVKFWPAATKVLLFVSNFAPTESMRILAHSWSLSIEEQFYLIWPLILCLYTKKSRTFPATVAVIGIVVTITFRWHHLAGGNDPSALYTTTVARLDSILIGALLAIWRIPVARALHRAGATWLLFGASIALIGLLIIGNRTMFLNTYWAFSAFACCSAAFILLSLIAKENHPVRRFLRLRPMIYMGSISYGLYIYHYPIFAALETLRIPGNTSNLVWVTTLKATLSAATASVSWHFLEQPMIEWRRHLFK